MLLATHGRQVEMQEAVMSWQSYMNAGLEDRNPCCWPSDLARQAAHPGMKLACFPFAHVVMAEVSRRLALADCTEYC